MQEREPSPTAAQSSPGPQPPTAPPGSGASGAYLPAGNQSASAPPPLPAGASINPSTGAIAVPGSRPTNTMAVVSLVAGIAGYVPLPHPFIAGLVAIFAGHTARRQIRQTGEGGANMALAGMVLGYAHLALSILAVGLLLLVVVGVWASIASQTR